MKKIISLLSVVTLMLFSCTQENDIPGTGNPDDVLVKRVDFGSRPGAPEQNSIQKFTYSGKKLSTMSIGPFFPKEIVYTYSGDVITGEDWFNADGGLLKKYVYEYDTANQLERVRLKIGTSGTLNLYKKYTYNPDGTVLENNDASNQLTYYFTNENISKTVQVTPSATTTLNYTYDAHNSPFKNVIGINKLLLFYQSDASFSDTFRVGNQHNIKSVISTTGEVFYKVNYTYGLLSHFPLKSVFMDASHSGSIDGLDRAVQYE